ncbi:unnamed protein product, partial [Darwinula stevensoni]
SRFSAGKEVEGFAFLSQYAVLNLLAAVGLAGAGSVLLYTLNKGESILWESLNGYVEEEAGNLYTQVWDRMQGNDECCGIEGPEDWVNSTAIIAGAVPISCCKNQIKCDTDNATSEHINQVGCLRSYLERLREWIEVGRPVTMVAIPMSLVMVCFFFWA